MRKTIVKVLILTAICILSFAGCGSQKGVADNSASVNPTTGATSTAENDSTAKPTETKKEPTKAPSTTLTPTVSSTVEPTKTPTKEPTQVPTKEPTTAPIQAPTSTPTNAQPTADPAIYPDDWGNSRYNNTIRTNGQEFFWTKTRHLVKIPKELQNVGFNIVDAENEQAFITTGTFPENLNYYALRDGVFYKLNQGKIVKKCYDGFNAFGWVEEDGTACSIGERSKYWNEVYIEGTNCKGIAYRVGGKLAVIKQDGEIVEPNKTDVLRESTIVK